MNATTATATAALDSTGLRAEVQKLTAEYDAFVAQHAACKRCGGSGTTQWKHIAGGSCFACDGTGSGPMTKANAKQASALVALANSLNDMADMLAASEQAAFTANAGGADDFLSALLAQPTGDLFAAAV